MKSIVAKLKLSFAALAVILILIVILQNMEPVKTRLLFRSMTMPQAVLLAATFLIGFAVGVMTTTWITRKRERKTVPQEKQPPPKQAAP